MEFEQKKKNIYLLKKNMGFSKPQVWGLIPCFSLSEVSMPGLGIIEAISEALRSHPEIPPIPLKGRWFLSNKVLSSI